MAGTETFYKMGFRMPWPEGFRHTKGLMSPMEIGGKGDGTYFMMCSYIASTAEEIAALTARSQNGEMSEEAIKKLSEAMAVLLVIIGIDGGQGIQEIKKILNMGEVSNDSFIEVGRYNDLTYYAITDRPSEEAFMKEQAPVYAEEFAELQKEWIEALKQAEYFGPKIPGEDLVGKTLRFESRDIDGNPVKSEELFAAHEVTMINLWATWCGPCKSELEELGKIHRSLEKKNAAVIGICDDGAEKAEECKALIREKNLTYLNILPYEGMDELAVQAVPTSFFVNREGKILTYPVIGVPADITEYEKTIDSLLNGGNTVTETAPADTVSKKDYRVIVKDETDAPVAGVRLQFCDDNTCMFAKTDAEGTACFSADAGNYTVHVQAVPEGYALNKDEIKVTSDTEEAEILLKKA